MALTMLATGDLMLQKPLLWPEAGGLRAVCEELHRADIAFANLEVPLTRREEAADKLICLRAEPERASDVRRAGVDVVTLANNHAFDYGPDGLRDTLGALGAAGVRAVGAGESVDEALRAEVVSVGGLRAAFVGLATTLPNGCGAGSHRPGVAPVRVLSSFVVDPVTIDEDPGMAPYVETTVMPGDRERAEAAIARAHESSDVVVVGIHWGVPHGWSPEFQGELADYQQPLGRALVDAGADAVIGHHPHVLHGVELYRGRPIFYSLGNFLFHSLLSGDPTTARARPPYSWRSLRGVLNHHGGLARLVWERPGPPAHVELKPIWLDEQGEPRWPLDEQAEAALARVADLSARLGTRCLSHGGSMKLVSEVPA